MPSTTEAKRAYNKEYNSRPEVIERKRLKNQGLRATRAAYKKTDAGIAAEKRYKQSVGGKRLQQLNRIKWRYGLSPEEFEGLHSSQGGKCAICSLIPPTPLHVDHDHETGKVRGLLCGSCNRAIGLLKDDTDLMRSAIAYLGASDAI
ncbi:endonuclease VII domain-containing protein [Arthrobacter cavernae]|uniref:Endonuclease VII domain-containing protein n=1 Tax=Arthrobacter cavernae TaxID=2817681 RepID=A0A939HGJ4_9MICC|nr:endonuclease VII domain-containing protein [Arthrobacter cavernae]